MPEAVGGGGLLHVCAAPRPAASMVAAVAEPVVVVWMVLVAVMRCVASVALVCVVPPLVGFWGVTRKMVLGTPGGNSGVGGMLERP